MDAPDPAVAVELGRRIEAGEAAVLATVVATEGAPPCRPGQKLLIGADGPIAGTLGCSELDAMAEADAGGALAGGASELRRYETDGGVASISIEPYPAAPVVVVRSASPVSGWLLRWARDLGYATVLVEGRADRITDQHRAGATRVVASVDEVRLGPTVAAAITDHDAPGVSEDVAAMLTGGVRMVALMGSRRHTSATVAALRDRGVSDADLARLNTPAGLDLGGRSAGEIALAMLAGLVADRHGAPGGWLSDRV